MALLPHRHLVYGVFHAHGRLPELVAALLSVLEAASAAAAEGAEAAVLFLAWLAARAQVHPRDHPSVPRH
jgi:hypothetical protein